MSRPPHAKIRTVIPPDKDKFESMELRKEAWIGDAVLALYVREQILAHFNELNGSLFIQLTSNDFLRLSGRPTGVEAAIGRAYSENGLQAGFDWIEENLKERMLECLSSWKNKKARP